MYYNNGLSFQEIWLEQSFATIPIDLHFLKPFIAATIVVVIGTMNTVARKFLRNFGIKCIVCLDSGKKLLISLNSTKYINNEIMVFNRTNITACHEDLNILCIITVVWILVINREK